ncbi:hypothetical protein ACPV5U_19360 [Vibrio mediterranei]
MQFPSLKRFLECQNVHTIYHGQCFDGSASAWAVQQLIDTNLTFEPGFYGKKIEEYEIPTDTDVVLLVDFSFKKEELLKLAERFYVVVVDHHVTAKTDLEDIKNSNIYVVFDMSESGASLVWKAFSSSPLPKLLAHVRDRDLWTFELPGTRAVNIALQTLGYDLDKFDEATKLGAEHLIQLGEPMLAYQQTLVKMIAEKSQTLHMVFQGENIEVPIVSAHPTLASDVAEYIYTSREVPFVVITNLDLVRGGLRVSLRSQSENGWDVSNVARHYGGGGHRCASGLYVNKLSDLGFVE